MGTCFLGWKAEAGQGDSAPAWAACSLDAAVLPAPAAACGRVGEGILSWEMAEMGHMPEAKVQDRALPSLSA